MYKSAEVIRGGKNTSVPYLPGNSQYSWVSFPLRTGQVCLHYLYNTALSAIFFFNWANSCLLLSGPA